jgi:hypothetical protein
VPKLRWGKYTANLLLVYDDGTKDVPIEGTLSFWVIPWRLIFGAIGLVVFIRFFRISWFLKPFKRVKK